MYVSLFHFNASKTIFPRTLNIEKLGMPFRQDSSRYCIFWWRKLCNNCEQGASPFIFSQRGHYILSIINELNLWGWILINLMLIIRSTYLILHVQFMQHCKGPPCGRADEKVREMLIMTLHKKESHQKCKNNKVIRDCYLYNYI